MPCWIRRGLRTSVATIVLACTALVASADGPAPYTILVTPSGRGGHHRAHQPTPTRVYPVMRPTYSYGWFGVPPRKHWQRHFGYYRNFTQWSTR